LSIDRELLEVVVVEISA